jgi:hypothetical protein
MRPVKEYLETCAGEGVFPGASCIFGGGEGVL